MGWNQKLERVNEYITTTIAILSGIGGALLCARFVGTGQTRNVLIIFAAVFVLILLLTIGARYWLLIPILIPVTGTSSIIPMHFSYAELGILFALAIYLVRVAFKLQHVGIRTRMVDWLLYLNLAWLATDYIRNPTGLLIFGGELIGGRTYFSIFIAFLAYLILAQNHTNEKIARLFPVLLAVPMIALGVLIALTQLFPPLGRVVGPIYSGVAMEGFRAYDVVDTSQQRFTNLADIAKPLIIFLCSQYPPATFVLPFRLFPFLGFCISMVFTGLSGFRNLFVASVAYIGLGACLHRAWRQIPMMGAVGVFGLIVIIGLQSAGIQLPFTFQRTLAFIPFVAWDPDAIRAGKDSTKWRVDMWKIAWTDPTIIRNKLLGDGFGFKASDFVLMQEEELGSGVGFMGETVQEAWLLKGSFHSGPLSTIRVVGIVGLVLFTIFMVFLAKEMLRIVRRTAGTPFFGWALFIAIPIIYQPFEFYFVFGAFATNFISSITALGLLKLLENSLDRWLENAPVSAQELQTGTGGNNSIVSNAPVATAQH